MNRHLASGHAIRLAVVAVLLAPASVLGKTVNDEQFGYVLQVPEGFVRVAPAELPKNVLHGFTLGDRTDDKPDFALIVKRMNGILGRKPLTQENAPRGFKGRIFAAPWQGFELMAFESTEEVNRVAMLVYAAQIPLKGEAIQIAVSGPAERKEELKRIFESVLMGLEGESNWIRSVPVLSSAANSRNYGAILGACTIAIVILSFGTLFVFSKFQSRHAVLGISIAMVMVSLGLAEFDFREIRLVSLALKFVGFVGVVWGIVILSRKGKAE